MTLTTKFEHTMSWISSVYLYWNLLSIMNQEEIWFALKSCQIWLKWSRGACTWLLNNVSGRAQVRWSRSKSRVSGNPHDLWNIFRVLIFACFVNIVPKHVCIALFTDTQSDIYFIGKEFQDQSCQSSVLSWKSFFIATRNFKSWISVWTSKS